MEHELVAALPHEYCEFIVWTFQRTLVCPPTDQLYGCMIPAKKPRKDGYVRVSIFCADLERAGVDDKIIDQLFPGRQPTHERNVYLHVLAFKAEHGSVPDGQNLHISHLCGVPACFLHLTSEAAQINNARKNCIRCVETDRIDADGKRIVVITCDGHGSSEICTLPLEYRTGNYALVKRQATPTGTTKIGAGGHVKQSRKVLYKEFQQRRKRVKLDQSGHEAH